MSKIKVTTATAPAYWASFLVNGDASGLDYDSPADLVRAEQWIEDLASEGWSVVSTTDEESYFARMCDAYGCEDFNGDVLEYVLHKQVTGLPVKFGVFAYDATNKYWNYTAVRTYKLRHAAQKYADKLNAGEDRPECLYVVRELRT